MFQKDKAFLFYILIFFSCTETVHYPSIDIAKFPKDKKAGLSFTFDDGCYSVITEIVPRLDTYGYKATFFIVPGYIKTDGYWNDWKELSGKGYEIGNHTLTHVDLETTTEAIARKEINDSFDLIKEKIGVAPFSFAPPYHRSTKITNKIIYEKHLVSRLRPKGLWSRYGLDPENANEFEEIIENAIQTNEWIVTSAHGVKDCFNPLSAEDFEVILSIAKIHENDLAIETFEHLAKYSFEKKFSRLKLLTGAHEAILRIESPLNKEVFNVPLTVVVNDPLLIHSTVENNEPGNPIAYYLTEGKLYIEMIPNSSVRLIY